MALGRPLDHGSEVELLERDGEIRALGELLSRAAAGEGGALVLQGPAGVGKTALLEGVATQAATRRFRVRRAAGAELEQSFPFGVARQLLAADLAGEDLAVGGEPAGEDELAARLYRISFAVAELADQAPLLLAVDDVHWVDEPSRRMLRYLARRIDDLAVAIVVATRPEHAPLEADRLADEAGARILRPRPLSPRAVGRLLDLREEAEVQAAMVASGGNPFLVRELATALADGEPYAALLDATGGSAAVPVARWIALRLGRLGLECSAVAEAAAILGDGVAVAEAAALASLSVEQTLEAAAVLERADVLHGGAQLRFRHALVRAAVLNDLGPAGSAAHHARALALLLGRGAPAARVAAHALEAPARGDPRVVAALYDAAAQARAAGDAPTAVRMLQRALAEPPDTETIPAVTIALGAALVAAGRAAHAVEVLRAAQDRTPAGAPRGRLAMVLASALGSNGDTAAGVAVLDDAQPEVAAQDLDLALQLRARAAWMSSLDGELAAQLPQRVAGAAELEGRTAGERSLLALAVTGRFYGGAPARDVVALALRALGDRGLAHELGPASVPQIVAIWMLLFCDELAAARREIDGLVDAGRGTGLLGVFAHACTMHGSLCALEGRLSEAESDLTMALTTWPQLPDDPIVYSARITTAAGLAAVQLSMRGAEEAAAGLDRLRLLARTDIPDDVTHMNLRLTRASIALARDRPDDALLDLESIRRFQHDSGFRNPVLAPGSLIALALHAAGREAEARQEAATAVELATAFGTPRVIGRALQARGLVAAGQDGTHDLQAAVGVLETCPDPVVMAEALADLGTALRRSNQRSHARPVLERCVDLAHRAGAHIVAERARDELRVLGARPRRLAFSGRDALTASERRIAELAAAGLTNRQIAQRLFVTTKTVENHLSSSFRKLDITSRHNLAAAISEERPD